MAISISTVQKYLNTTDNKLNKLCTHSNINVWSKIKPIQFDTSNKLKPIDYKNKNYGLDVKFIDGHHNEYSPYEKGLNNAFAKAQKLNGFWNKDALYLKPTKYFRLGDFDGYDSDASFPIEIRIKPEGYESSEYLFDQLVKYRYSTNPNNVEIDGLLPHPFNAWYPSIIYSTNGGKILFKHSDTPIETIVNNAGQDYTLNFQLIPGITEGYIVLAAPEIPNFTTKPEDLDLQPEKNQYFILDNSKFLCDNIQTPIIIDYYNYVDFNSGYLPILKDLELKFVANKVGSSIIGVSTAFNEKLSYAAVSNSDGSASAKIILTFDCYGSISSTEPMLTFEETLKFPNGEIISLNYSGNKRESFKYVEPCEFSVKINDYGTVSRSVKKVKITAHAENISLNKNATHNLHFKTVELT